jgi:uncharacterized NAD(P)/FAD-binding protein YdhS
MDTIANLKQQEVYSIGIVGGGLSALVLLYSLGRAFSDRKNQSTDKPRVLLVDENPPDHFGRGLPYASPEQSGSRAELLNSPASRMGLESIIGDDGNFVRWLQTNTSGWHQLLDLEHDDSGALAPGTNSQQWPEWEAPAISRWLDFNRDKLEAGIYETVYFPRSVYGKFIDTIAGRALALAQSSGIELSHVQARVEEISSEDGHSGPFKLALHGNGTNAVARVGMLVYSGGDLTSSSLNPDGETSDQIVNHPYGVSPTRHERHARLLQAMEQANGEPVKLLLAGGNACAMDQLWALDNNPQLHTAIRQGQLQIVMVSPGDIPNPGTVLLPAPEDEPADSLRWLQAEQQALLDEVVDRNLDPGREFTASSYAEAVATALQELKLEQNPHLFMLFLRKLGEVEQQIRDRLTDVTEFARDYHPRVESLILFTPCEYWQVLIELMALPDALQHMSARVEHCDRVGDQVCVTLDNGEQVLCSMAVNCTGPRNPFTVPGGDAPGGNALLDQLVAQQLGRDNLTGGLRTSTEGRLQLADGRYSRAAYLCTQCSQGLQQPAEGGDTRFVSANRLTAVKVAEQAQRIAIDLARRL